MLISCKKALILLFPFIAFLFYCSSSEAQVISTYAGNGNAAYSGDGGPAASAGFNDPIGIAMDSQGNLYVAEFYSNRIRKINKTTGIVTTVAGNGSAGYSGDGGPAVNAQLNNPSRIAVDNAGNIYIADNLNFSIRKVTAATGIITTVATTGSIPSGIAADAAGNFYFSQYPADIVSKGDAVTGAVGIIAGIGSAGYSGDGGLAITAALNFPAGLSIDASGNIYVADILNNCIRKIAAATGIITSIAGNGTAGFAGDGGPAAGALLNGPSAAFVDAAGNIFITDRNNDRVRKIDAVTGNISTIAGIGNYGFGGDGGSPTGPCVKLADPIDVLTDMAGNIYFSDQSNSRIRKIDTTTNSPAVTSLTIAASANNICAGTPVTFTAVAANPGSNPIYQWKVNGINTGTNSATYTSNTFNNNDIILCELSTTVCTVSTVTSNSVTMTVTPATTPDLSIDASQTSFCAASPVNITFTANPSGGGSAPSYQWQVNGVNTGSNAPVFNTITLADADVVQCIMTSNLACTTSPNAASNKISITAQPVQTPVITIATQNAISCAGSGVTFNAMSTNEGSTPVYQWQVNGIAAGTNNPVFVTTTLVNGDVVNCVLTTNAACVTSNMAVSNSIPVTIITTTPPTLSIEASSANICQGTPVVFTATALHANADPSYQWQVNGLQAGTDSNIFISTTLANGDQVNCILIDKNGVCNMPVLSANSISMIVNPVPLITITPADTAILYGSTIQLNAMVSGSIMSMQWAPATGLNNSTIPDPLAAPLATISYSLTVLGTDGCKAEGSSLVTVLGKFAMPDSFTPNGDGHNDVFRIPPGTLFSLYDLSVFDRWGNKIFTTANAGIGWDGTYKGKQCDTGTYVYMISGSDGKKPVFLKGTVILIR